jgi:hypothetical protein
MDNGQSPFSILYRVVPQTKMENSRLYCRMVPYTALWSSDQNSWLQIQRSWIRFKALPDFLEAVGLGSNQPREDKGGAT